MPNDLKIMECDCGRTEEVDAACEKVTCWVCVVAQAMRNENKGRKCECGIKIPAHLTQCDKCRQKAEAEERKKRKAARKHSEEKDAKDK